MMHAAAISRHGRVGTDTQTGHSLSRRIKAYFIGRRIARRTHDELDMTSDRELADLGLSRFDVGHIAALAGRQAAEKFLAS